MAADADNTAPTLTPEQQRQLAEKLARRHHAAFVVVAAECLSVPVEHGYPFVPRRPVKHPPKPPRNPFTVSR